MVLHPENERMSLETGLFEKEAGSSSNHSFSGDMFSGRKKTTTTNPRNNQVISRLVDANFQKTHRNTTMKQLGVSLYISGGLSTVVGPPLPDVKLSQIWSFIVYPVSFLKRCLVHKDPHKIPKKENSKCVRMSVNENKDTQHIPLWKSKIIVEKHTWVC